MPSSPSLPLPSSYRIESDPDVLGDHADAAERIARAGGVRLMRGREIAAVVLHESNEVVAGLWTQCDQDSFTFDVAVAAAHQRRGLGRCLAEMGLAQAQEQEREVGTALELDAISPGGEALARHLGLIEATRAGGHTIFKTPKTMLREAGESLIADLPRVGDGDLCGGFRVRHSVPNTSSIEATLGSAYASHGVREVPMTLLGPDPEPSVRARLASNPRIASLAAQIKESGEVNPLIVVVNGLCDGQDGPAYILEGSHRIDALELLGAKTFPALVVQDLDVRLEVEDAQGKALTPAERFAFPTPVTPPDVALLSGAARLPEPILATPETTRELSSPEV